MSSTCGRSGLITETYRINAFVNKLNSTGYLTRGDYDTIGAEVPAQCDPLDGVKDNVITNPLVCRPQLSILSCDQPTANQSTCLSYDKINIMYQNWADYHSVLTGEWLSSAYRVCGPASSCSVASLASASFEISLV